MDQVKRLGVHLRAVPGKHYNTEYSARGLTRDYGACFSRTTEEGRGQECACYAGMRGPKTFVAGSFVCENLKSYFR